MLQREEILLIVYVIGVILLIVTFGLIFFVAFQKRKNKLLTEKFEVKQNFERELAASQIEIQEQTLKNVAWELHDNIGQLLSVSNMQLNILSTKIPGELNESVGEIKEVVQSAIHEVRALSKTLNSEIILNNGLADSIKIEVERFNRLKYLHATFEVLGNKIVLKPEQEIIIFRILQEFFSNVVKHAKAKNLKIVLEYTDEVVNISASDDGIGFKTGVFTDSSGLKNMKSRANILGADFELNSVPGEGTSIKLKCCY